MKTFKKALSIILGLAMMLSCVAGMHVSAEGASSFTVTVGNGTAKPGDTVEIPVTLSNVVGGYTALGFAIDYDPAVLTLAEKVAVDSTYEAKLEAGDIADAVVFEQSENLTDDPYNLIWAFVDGEAVTTDGVVATLKFTVNANATAGDITTVAIAANAKSGSMNGNADVAVEYVNGTVTVAEEEPECEYVDANQDGRCDNCGEENLDETLTFYNKGIVLSADIRGVLQVRKIKATSPYDSFKVIMEKGGVESELVLASTSDKTNYTTYSYTMTVPAKELADVTNLRIVGITAEGVASTSNTEEWSIKAGLIDSMDTYSAQGTEDAAKRIKLCANILNYGAEAQKHFSYNVDNLATDGLKAEYTALIITTTPEMVSIPMAEEPDGTYATLKEIGFNLAARVQVLPRFIVPKADSKDSYRAEITKVHTAPDGTETTSSFTLEGDKILKGASSTSLYVYIDNLASKELRDVMTITLYKDDVAVSVVHTFSGESALYGKMANLPTLAPALMNYCDCARAVFG